MLYISLLRKSYFPDTSPETCTKPTIENGSVSPSDDTIEAGSSYTATCNNGYTLSGTATMECNDDGTLMTAPTCAG